MMVNPKLFAKYNRITTVINTKCLKNYNHLIKWRNYPSIMEIGHGDGGASQRTFFPHLPSNLKEFVATDVSLSMLEYARKNSILPSIKFEQLDITAKEVPSQYLERFDHIFGFCVMHMVKDPRQGFLNMHKMLKPGGSIFLTIAEHTLLDDILDELSKHPKWSKYGVESLISPYFYSPNPRREWETDLNQTGFKNHEIFEEYINFEFLDDDEFDNFLLSVCIFLPNIPEDELEMFKTMFREKTRKGKMMRIQLRDGKERISVRFKIFIISANKTT